MLRKDFKFGLTAGAAIVVLATVAVSFWPSERFEVDLTLVEARTEELAISERQIIEEARQQNKVEPPTEIELPKTPTFPSANNSNDNEPDSNSTPQEQPLPIPERIHVVQSGETLSSISRKYYGSVNQWRRIVEANRDKIQDGQTIIPGMRLRIPK